MAKRGAAAAAKTAAAENGESVRRLRIGVGCSGCVTVRMRRTYWQRKYFLTAICKISKMKYFGAATANGGYKDGVCGRRCWRREIMRRRKQKKLLCGAEAVPIGGGGGETQRESCGIKAKIEEAWENRLYSIE